MAPCFAQRLLGRFFPPWHPQVTHKPGEVRSVSPQSRVPFPAVDARINTWTIKLLEKRHELDNAIFSKYQQVVQ